MLVITPEINSPSPPSLIRNSYNLIPFKLPEEIVSLSSPSFKRLAQDPILNTIKLTKYRMGNTIWRLDDPTVLLG